MTGAYRDDADRPAAPPGAATVGTARRGRPRAAIVAAVAAVAAVTAGALLLWASPDPSPDGGMTGVGASAPIPSPSGPASVTPPASPPATTAPAATSGPAAARSLDLRAVDWRYATFYLPADRAADCPGGWFTTRGEATRVGDNVVRMQPRALAQGDLNRDGRADAVVYIHCARAEGDSGDGAGQLLVVIEERGRLFGIGFVGPRGENFPRATVTGGTLVATIEQRYGPSAPQERRYRWQEGRFVQVGGPTAFPES